MNLKVTSSPHIRSNATTSRIMIDVAIALLPAVVAGTLIFGLRALIVCAVSVASALLFETLFCLIAKKPITISDGSAAVTGLLLALTLPASVPYLAVAAGSGFAVVVVKCLFGGLGKNIFNPALSARALLMLVCPVYLVRYAAPGAALSLLGNADIVSAATPLHHMQMPALPEASLLDMFLGKIGGSIGEVSALALLVGGIYLVVRRVISARIPLAYLGSVAALTLIFYKGEQPLMWMLYSLLGGGVMLGAIFMATDYATSPVTHAGQLIYGIGCGALTVFFRYFGLFPEGVTYAILIMNALVFVIDKITAPRVYGTGKGVRS